MPHTAIGIASCDGFSCQLRSEGGRIYHRGSGRLCEEDPEEPEQQAGCRTQVIITIQSHKILKKLSEESLHLGILRKKFLSDVFKR